jgi:hypothetical protein
MQFETFSALMDIRRRWRSDYGKIIQLLLAISFDARRGGFQVQNHSIEGVDLEISQGAKKFAIEVKTTEKSYISLRDKDVCGLKTKATVYGCIPAIAALRLRHTEDRSIANASRLLVGKCPLARLHLDRITELEFLAKTHFGNTVAEVHDRIMSPLDGSPLNYLSTVLKKESQYRDRKGIA